jgi:mitogen-activated protein kinase kinase 3
MALTVDAGSKFYMAPERIDPEGSREYNIRSDVWSLGISMIEMATGKFPYRIWGNIFDQIKEVNKLFIYYSIIPKSNIFKVVEGEAPRLPPEMFSSSFEDLIAKCLQKKCLDRPNYEELLATDFVKEHTQKDTNVALFVQEILGKAESA